MLSYFANAGRFKKLTQILLPLFIVLALLFFMSGLYTSLYASPPDYQQGETVRIMYVHVPAAWWALGLYVGMALAALIGFVWKHTLADIFCRAAAPVGACLTALCLVTGSLWGKPMWGTWWVWDARLTSMLLLLFLYLGAMALRAAFDNEQRGIVSSQLLLMIGLINIPIIKFSVDWWNTLHQGATVLRAGGSALHPSMAVPLGLMAAAFFFYTGAVIMARMRVMMRQMVQKPQ